LPPPSAVEARDARIAELEGELEAAREDAAQREAQLRRACAAKLEQLRALHEAEVRRLAGAAAARQAGPCCCSCQSQREGQPEAPAAAAAAPPGGAAEDSDARSALAAMERLLERLSAALRAREAEVAALRAQSAAAQQQGRGGAQSGPAVV
jgi:hypothetical protein